jgi:hypothetical protein
MFGTEEQRFLGKCKLRTHSRWKKEEGDALKPSLKAC